MHFIFCSVFAIIIIYEENIATLQTFYCWILMLHFGTSIRYQITGKQQGELNTDLQPHSLTLDQAIL